MAALQKEDANVSHHSLISVPGGLSLALASMLTALLCGPAAPDWKRRRGFIKPFLVFAHWRFFFFFITSTRFFSFVAPKSFNFLFWRAGSGGPGLAGAGGRLGLKLIYQRASDDGAVEGR